MTMSVGLGRIINDPKASVLVRKALGTLSTPELIVTDEGVTINDDGKIAIKLNPNGGLAQDADGLSVGVANTGIKGSTIGHPVVTGFVGVQVNLELPKFIDPINTWSYYAGDAQSGLGSSVTNFYGYYVADMTEGTDLNAAFCGNVQAATDAWNVYMLGTAPNYFAGSVSIGTTGIPAKLNVESTTEQLRIQYNSSNYFTCVVGSTGGVTIQGFGASSKFTLKSASSELLRMESSGAGYCKYSISTNGIMTHEVSGSAPGFNFVTPSGYGVQINSGTVVQIVLSQYVTVNVYGSFGSPVQYTDEQDVGVTGVRYGDAVLLTPLDLPHWNVASYFAACIGNDVIRIRFKIQVPDVNTYTVTFRVTVIRFT